MLDHPTVTIVIATHSRPALLRACVESLAGVREPDQHVMIVESGEASAAKILAEVGMEAEVRHVDAIGKTAKMNEALRHVATEVALFSDDDCRFERGWASAMAASFDDPGVGMAFGPVSGISQAPGGPPGTPPAPGPAPYGPWTFAHGPSMALRTQAARDAGGFDERLGPGTPARAGEEADLLLRVREKGWRCVTTGAPEVRHVDWRSDEEDAANYRVFAFGAGAYIGAALRRAPRANVKLFALLTGHYLELWRDRVRSKPSFGPAIFLAFGRGVAHGLRLRPRPWLS